MLLRKIVLINNCNVDDCSFFYRSCFSITHISLIFILFFINTDFVSAQCYNCSSQNPSSTLSITPNTGSQIISTNMQGGNYALCNVETGVTYTWTTCNNPIGSFNTQLTLFNNLNCIASSKIDYNNDYSGCGNKSKIVWTATFTGVVKILVSKYINYFNNCQSTTNTEIIKLEWEATIQNCYHPTLLCNGNTYSSGLINQNHIAPSSSPNWGTNMTTTNINNQIWYYFQIAQPGQIKIDINANNYNDIDGVLWGPINDISSSCNATTSTPAAYNFNISNSYQLIINPTVSDIGKYYLLMISSVGVNYSSSCNISFTNTTVGKITLCPPVLSYNQPLCEGNNLHLSASSTVSGASYHWTGPNGFTSNLQNPLINNISATNSGTYSCYYTTAYGISSISNITITVNPKPLTSNIYHN